MSVGCPPPPDVQYKMEVLKRRIIRARIPMEPTFEQQLMSRLLEKVCGLLTASLPAVNRRCAPYEKGKDTQDKGINKNFENLVGDAARGVLSDLGYKHWSAILDDQSDVSLETDTFILQVDAKGCIVTDGDFCKKTDGFLHGHCGKAQTSLVSTSLFTHRKTGQKYETRGLQKPFVDGKPVYTFVAYMRWGYSPEAKYYVETCGVVWLPHSAENIDFRVGKSHDEMRWVIKSPSLYQIHRFASESPSRIPDSAQSECNDIPTTSQQFQ